MFKKIKRLLMNPKILVRYFLTTKYSSIIPDKTCIKILYRLYMGKNLDLENPTTFNEKLQWLKLYDRKQVYTIFVDKYNVRNYISEQIGEKYLIPLLGVWDRFDDIDFDTLPEQFVLKVTHDSGGIVICKDKSSFDLKVARNKINSCFKRNYYWIGREWAYKNLTPRIIAEKYMVDKSEDELIDYKFMCFNGKVKCIFVCHNRNSESGLNIDIHDNDWNLMPVMRPGAQNSGQTIEKPKNFEKMIAYSEKLSMNIPFIRVDFYETSGQLYFGELTFFPNAGFKGFVPESYDYLLGSWIDLPNRN